MILTGWGRTCPSSAEVVHVSTEDDIVRTIVEPSSRGVLARGLGRSYGDSAQSAGGRVLDMTRWDAFELDPAAATVRARSGASLDDILRVAVPQGLFVPVSPGTRFVTIGGAVAADIHGKNHHVEGSFGSHVRELRLITGEGRAVTLSPDHSPEEFWATVGGMGLTGVIAEACVSMLPIESSRMRVDTERFENLGDLMDAMVSGDDRYRYSVAWVDSLSTSGRGVLTRGDHASLADLPSRVREDPLAYDPKVRLGFPAWAPRGLLSGPTIAAFNEAWFRKTPRRKFGQIQSIPEFFHPLDEVRRWNHAYGSRGFLQYQFVVPDDAGHVVERSLSELRKAGAPSFLTVHKRFGPGNPGPLSFPKIGWTLAADVAAGVPGLGTALDRLDELVCSVGGRLYLAKDSRMSRATLEAGYPRLKEWRAVRDTLDPRGLFISDQARRLAPALGSWS